MFKSKSRLYLALFTALVVSCKANSRSPDGTSLRADANLPKGYTDGPSRVARFAAPFASDQLAAALWRSLSAVADRADLEVQLVDNATALIMRDKEPRYGSLFCSRDEETISCDVKTRSWPSLPPDLTRRLLIALRPATGVVTLGIPGSGGALVCGMTCELLGLDATFEFPFEAPGVPAFRRPVGPASVEPGATDEDGTPLPGAPSAFITELDAAGGVRLAGYRATNQDLADYWNALPAGFKQSFESAWTPPESEGLATLNSLKGCRKEEIASLRDYASAAGATGVNRTLRVIRKGQVEGLAPSAALVAKIKVIASGIRCVASESVEVTYRGANLTEQQLARYREGRTVVERGFTSTSPSGVPDNFIGNVEFRIWDAQGAMLRDINPFREEDELLIQAGTLFKVTWRGPDERSPERTVVEMQQIFD